MSYRILCFVMLCLVPVVIFLGMTGDLAPAAVWLLAWTLLLIAAKRYETGSRS